MFSLFFTQVKNVAVSAGLIPNKFVGEPGKILRAAWKFQTQEKSWANLVEVFILLIERTLDVSLQFCSLSSKHQQIMNEIQTVCFEILFLCFIANECEFVSCLVVIQRNMHTLQLPTVPRSQNFHRSEFQPWEMCVPRKYFSSSWSSAWPGNSNPNEYCIACTGGKAYSTIKFKNRFLL